jgi:ATP-dependent DNA helicase
LIPSLFDFTLVQFSLLNFLLPVIFDDLQVFQSWFAFEQVGEAEGDSDIIANQRKEKVVTKLHDILRPFLLRRLKKQVLVGMPPKRELVVYTPMTETQRGMHELIRTGELNKVLKQVGSKQTLRNMLMQMRKCCNHPFLFEGAEQSDENGQFQDDEDLVQSSGKLQIMDKILPVLRKNDHKVDMLSELE